MERVAFLVESTGQRLGCMLNPESLEVHRTAGVRPRRAATGLLAGSGSSDDPLLYTGGGRTELTLDLLFDVDIAGSTVRPRDVRDLTRPLWELAESRQPAAPGATAPVVRFLWGKSWNVPGIVTAAAERLERFASDGASQRSWLRIRLVRVSETEAEAASRPRLAPPSSAPGEPGQQLVHPVLTAGPDPESVERPDGLAYRYYGDPSAWRDLLASNRIDDPGRIPPGTNLEIPPASELGESR